jgi:lipopolysaccharide transport system permease protein
LASRRLSGADGVLSATGTREIRHERWTIEPIRVGLIARVREFWRYRRILWFFASRRIKERYESTTLGMFWLFARPLLPILLSSAIFGLMLGIKSDGVPYFLFFLTGSSCWRLFERSVIAATRSLEQSRGLIKKVYFPRLVAPIASVAPSFIEFAIMVGLTLVVGGFYYYRDGDSHLRLGFLVLLAPVAAGLAILLALAVGFWTSVFQVRHRDVQLSLRYVLQFWLYATPIIYAHSAIPERFRFLASLNPMTGVVELYKWSLLGVGDFPGRALVPSIAITLTIFVTGAAFFNRAESASVDRL